MGWELGIGDRFTDGNNVYPNLKGQRTKDKKTVSRILLSLQGPKFLTAKELKIVLAAHKMGN